MSDITPNRIKRPGDVKRLVLQDLDYSKIEARVFAYCVSDVQFTNNIYNNRFANNMRQRKHVKSTVKSTKPIAQITGDVNG